MVSKLASKLGRAKYILTRLRESPPKFLLLKGAIELRKKTGRGAVMKAAAAGKRFSGSFERDLTSKRTLGAQLRVDVVRELRSLESPGEQLIGALAGDFDAGSWPCLGFGDYALRPGMWALDDFHAFTWPRDYFADIDYVMVETCCDTKVPWEKSRMQWFSGAALACCLESDPDASDRRMRKAIALVDDWIAENPYGVGVNRVSSMEVAIRSVNLLFGFSLLEDQLDDEAARRLLQSAGEHLYYLKRFPETSDVQGNHYLATVLGEYFLEEFGGTRSDASAQTFVAACKEQFSAEGLHIEFSPTYHRLSLDMVAIGFALMRRQRPSVAVELEPLLERCVETCRILANHEGELPILSDNDSGMVLNFHQSARRFSAYQWLQVPCSNSLPCEPVGATLPESIFGAVLAGLCGKYETSRANPEVEAATKPSVAETSGTKPKAKSACSKISSRPPFAALEDGTSKVVVRAGALGLSGRASHDHDDALSFWYSVDGVDLIVEAGCPPYTRDREERLYAIASTSHNLLTASGQERFQGAVGSVTTTLRGGHEGRISFSDTDGEPELCAELVAGKAVSPSANPMRHVRRFRLQDGVLRIVDQATLVDAAVFQLRLHLAPGIDVKDVRISGQSVAVTQGAREFEFQWDGCDIDGIVTEPYTCHLDYGASVPALCLVISGPAPGEVKVTTSVITRSPEGQAAC